MDLPVKPLALILVVLCILRELRNGYFRQSRHYLQSESPGIFVRILGTTGLLFGLTLLIDLPLSEWIRAQSAFFFTEVSRLGGIMGKGANPWLAMGALYCTAMLLKRERWIRLSFACLLSSGLTAAAANLLKITVLRARPYMTKGPFAFFDYQGLAHFKNDFFSFPSGDVAVVAGASAYLFYSVKNIYVRSIFLVLPVMTAISRVDRNKHWPSDTIFSIGLGLAAALLVAHYERFRKPLKEGR